MCNLTKVTLIYEFSDIVRKLMLELELKNKTFRILSLRNTTANLTLILRTTNLSIVNI